MIAERLLDYLQARLRAGDDGKTLLIGLLGDAPRFAIAAGLRGERDHPRFLIFARYLLHGRQRCDGFALMSPALVGGAAVYVMELCVPGYRSVDIVEADGSRRAVDMGTGTIGDLSQRGPALPGIMRRDLDALYEKLALPLPETPADGLPRTGRGDCRWPLRPAGPPSAVGNRSDVQGYGAPPLPASSSGCKASKTSGLLQSKAPKTA